MQRSVNSLVMTARAAAGAAIALVVLCGVAQAEASPSLAVSPVVKLSGDATLTGALPARFHVHVAFSTDTPGAELFTVQQAVVYFPDHAGTNGSLFPSCGAKQIERHHGNVARCPKKSQIGSGTVKASAIQLGITAAGRVTMFNSAHGKDITFNFQTNLPAYINESLDAPITQLHGKYGEKLTIVVPHSLQEILSGVFVGVRDFDVVLSGSVRAHGVSYSYLKARTCPNLPMRGVFGFKNWTSGQVATATADAKVRCRRP
jgi:hypothetical protein